MAATPEHSNTRDKVLVTAGEIFAEKGFRKATVREIAARAGANLNAVNYYFGDKQGLYLAVIESAHRAIEEDEFFRPARDPATQPRLRLKAFITSFLQRATAQGPTVHLSRIVALEMAEPTGALETVVERFIRPRFLLLTQIVRLLVGDRLSQHRVELCAQSIIGQCAHLAHARRITTRLMPHLTYSPEDIEELAAHVTQFSLRALERVGDTDEDSE